VRHARNVQGLSRYYSEAERYNAERIERQQPKDVLGEIAKQKWTGHYPEQEVSVGLGRLRLRGLLSGFEGNLKIEILSIGHFGQRPSQVCDELMNVPRTAIRGLRNRTNDRGVNFNLVASFVGVLSHCGERGLDNFGAIEFRVTKLRKFNHEFVGVRSISLCFLPTLERIDDFGN